jgi:hypothetical protein
MILVNHDTTGGPETIRIGRAGPQLGLFRVLAVLAVSALLLWLGPRIGLDVGFWLVYPILLVLATL